MTSAILPLICLFAATALRADEATKIQKLEEYFRLTKTEETMQQSFEIITKQLKSGVLQQLTGAKLDSTHQKLFDEFNVKAEKLVVDGLSWKKLKGDYVKLYAELYTEEELDEILRFYRSAVGKAMVDKQPVLMTKSGAIAQKKMLEIIPQLQQLSKDYVNQLSAAPKQP
jgi:hypothetical protein